MAKGNQNIKKSNWRELFNTNAGIWILVVTIFGAGFGTGKIVVDVFHKIELNELNQEYNNNLYERVKEFDELILELKNENHLLKIENEKLRK